MVKEMVSGGSREQSRSRAERIIVVDDDRAFRVATQTLLEDEGYSVEVATCGEESLRLLAASDADLLLSDLMMGKMSGIELLQRVRKQWPSLPVIMVTGFGSISTAVEAMRIGATDYLTKPCNNEELLIKIRRVLDIHKTETELRALRDELQSRYRFGNMISRSEKMKDVMTLIRQVADADVTVLVQGESGTGKELVARALHFNSIRKDGPFVPVNCSALPENLMESELFGHEKGAFTGAVKQRAGKFEEADGGTLFLDEIGELPLAVQAKLLRVLQEKSLVRVGGSANVLVETRVVAASNRNLELMMREGDFREDLFYRINVFPIHLPPLRERLEDIPLLAQHFLERHADLGGGVVKQLAPSLLPSMMRYSWRGNVRELENLVKRAILKSTSTIISHIEFPAHTEETIHASQLQSEQTTDSSSSYKDFMSTILREAEEKYLIRILRQLEGNVNQAAKLMEIDRKTVYRKMAEYSIDPSTFRDK